MQVLKIYLKDANGGIFPLPDAYEFEDSQAAKLIEHWKNHLINIANADAGAYKCKIITAYTDRRDQEITLMLRLKDVVAIG